MSVKYKVRQVLRGYIEDNGITQRELAKLIGMKESHLSRLLSTDKPTTLNLALLDNICEALSLTPNDLLWEQPE